MSARHNHASHNLNLRNQLLLCQGQPACRKAFGFVSSWLYMPPQNPEEARWFAEEIAPHESKLHAWLAGRFPSLSDHEDIIQEAFIRVLKARETVRLLSPKSFLFATAKNLALDQLKKKQVMRIDFSLANSDCPDVLDEDDNPHESYARSQELAILTQAIQSLPQRCRQIFTLRKVYGLSQKEISERLGVSAVPVSSSE